jgi:soluble lytic murein transglycosylase
MGDSTRPNERGPRIIILNKRALISTILLVIVVALISSNTFWRWMYPIRYQENIQFAAKTAEVDPLLVASVIRVESKFRSEDVSHAGAIGLMQLMPETASWIAMQMQKDNAGQYATTIRQSKNLAEPASNIMLGSWYIHYLTNRFDGNEIAAIAAYNAGPKRVQSWLSDREWNGSLSTINQIPVGETRHFVDRVFYNYALYRRIYGQDANWKVPANVPSKVPSSDSFAAPS